MRLDRWRIAGIVVVAALMVVPVSLTGSTSGALSPPSGVHGSLFPAVAVWAVTITPSCTVSPSGAPITASGTTFTVTSSFWGRITDDCNGSSIGGAGSTLNDTPGGSVGVVLTDVDDVAVTGLTVTNESTAGFGVAESTDIRLASDTVVGTGYAVQAGEVNSLTVTNGRFNGTAGIDGTSGANWTISGTQLQGTTDGILVSLVEGLSVSQSNLSANGGSTRLSAEFSDGVTLRSNAFYDTSGFTNAQIVVAYDSDVEVDWNNGTLGTDGVVAAGCTEFSFDHNRFSSAGTGAELESDSLGNLNDNSFQNATSVGFEVVSSANVTIAGNDAVHAAVTGFESTFLSNSLVSDNNLSYAGTAGVELLGASNVTLTDEQASFLTSPTGVGFDLALDTSVTLSGSTATYDAIGVEGIQSDSLTVDHDTFSDETGSAADGGTFQVDTGLVVRDDDFSHSGATGFLVEGSLDVEVAGVDAQFATGSAFELESSTDVAVSDVGLNQSAVGLLAEVSQEVAIAGLWANQCSTTAVEFSSDQNVTAAGLVAVGGKLGILAVSNNALTITASNVSQQNYSLELGVNFGLNVSGSTFWDSNYSFEMLPNSGVVYHNNFVLDKAWAIPVAPMNPTFAWNSPYPSGGNYWSNYTGADLKSGPGQNLSGPDGIGDTPFVLNVNNSDRYPLMKPWSERTFTFVEAGLPASTAWSVVWDDQSSSSTSSTIVFVNPNGANTSYAYSVTPIPGYRVTPSMGSGSVGRTNVSVDLLFSVVNYTVTFSAPGLSSTTAWSVTVGGRSVPGTGTSITVSEPNGTYNYSVGAIPTYSLSPSAGEVRVVGASVTVTLNATRVVYALKFAETGLSNGTNWSVTVDGTTQYSNGSSITFLEPNGTHSYAIGSVGGYNSPTPVGGSANVSGGANEVGVVYTPTSSTSILRGTSGILLLGLIAVALIAAVGWLLALRRRKPPSPKPITPAEVPAAASGAVGATPPAPEPWSEGDPPPPS